MVKKLTICLLVIVSVVLGSVSALGSLSGSIETLLEIPVGDGPGEVGYDTSRPEMVGPEAIFATDDAIFILDSANRRVLAYRDKQLTRVIDISFVKEPRDLVVGTNGDLYVHDAEQNQILRINQGGTQEEAIPIPLAITERDIRRLSIGKDGLPFLVCDGKEYAVGTWISSSGYSNVADSRQFTTRIIDKKNVEVIANGEPLVTIAGGGEVKEVVVRGVDRKGTVYVTNWDLDPNSSRIQGYLTIRAFTSNGNCIGLAALETPESEIKAFSPNRWISIAPNGDVYRLVCFNDKVEVQEIKMGDPFRYRNPSASSTAEATIAPLSIPPDISRSEVNTRANAQISLSWTYNQANGTNPPSEVTKPDWLQSTTYGTTVTGIPYCWGGFDATDKSSAPSSWSSFKDAMSKGKFAGNVNCTGYYKSGTAGLDCAGFVSAAANYDTRSSTYGLYDNQSYDSFS